MRSVVSDVQDLLHEVGDSSSSTVSEFKSRLSRALDVARDRLDTIDGSMRTNARQAATSARQAATMTDDYARAHPWHIVSAGALVGLAIGLLIARR